MIRSKRSWWRVIAAVAALSLVAAACGDDDDDGDGTGAEEPGEQENRGTIKIGIVEAGTSATTGQTEVAEAEKIAREWARQVNADGGINGYDVEIVVKTGTNDTARVLQSFTELDQEGVHAVVQRVAQVITGSVAKIKSAKLPIVGGVPYTPEFDTEPLFFQVSSSYYAGVAGQVSAAKHAGANHFRNAYCTEVPACAQSVPVTEKAAKHFGLQHSAVGASARAVDYTAVCLAAKQAGVTFFQGNGMNTPNLVRDCKRQAYNPIYGVGGAANQRTVEALDGEKYAGNLYEFGAFYDGPEVQRFRQAVERTDLEDGQWGQTVIQAWLGLEMIGAAMERLDVDNPTRADFLEALYSIEDEDLDGQIAPVDYTDQKSGDHFLQDCWTEHTVIGGKLVHMGKDGKEVSKLTFICDSGDERLD
jgi:ABC-type branched-subunit amino acid transport system substrate-binding protein